jgi:hypothetical protein
MDACQLPGVCLIQPNSIIHNQQPPATSRPASRPASNQAGRQQQGCSHEAHLGHQLQQLLLHRDARDALLSALLLVACSAAGGAPQVLCMLAIRVRDLLVELCQLLAEVGDLVVHVLDHGLRCLAQEDGCGEVARRGGKELWGTVSPA